MTRSVLTLSLTLLTAAPLMAAEYKSGIQWKQPPAVDPGGPQQPPSDAIVLFGGKDMSKWKGGENWIVKDGYVTAAKNSISTKQEFGDIQLHVEFATPAEVKGKGQGRGNSGVYLMGRYEVQILDSYKNETYDDGQAAAIYKQSPPLVNASRPPGEWQTYDIIFRAPRFNEDGSLKSPAAVTVLHNGVLVQNDYELKGRSSYNKAPKYTKHPPKQPLHLQYHGNPVRFRNIWVREVKQMQDVKETPKKEGEKPAKKSDKKPKSEKDSPKKAEKK